MNDDFLEIDRKTMDTEKKASVSTMPGQKSNQSSGHQGIENDSLALSMEAAPIKTYIKPKASTAIK